MTITPKFQLVAKALIELDAATAEGRTALGFDTGRVSIPEDADQVGTLSITLAPAADVEINFITLAQDAGAAAIDAEGDAINFEKIYALGIKATGPVGVATATAAAPWLVAPLPSTAAPINALSAIGEFALTGGSKGAIFTNNGIASITLEIIAIGVKN